ncbi:hypothetical protein Daura_49685 [Dactylosporangium aurantiacum]|uniref:EcsC protein family protein n=1 Tax=Dactylosporangium aurantiacum TaxID=35754 RepID=A0A9Q9IHU4_9ACTN|nr:hypothetical protein [Dactylosporangium aurantiacum]MDG6107451.1 hypothetical protein [Dactylosporangium aurantiacum]UWZ54425.1 hypothetical protein Daura_49685 [Dactylosporangium aurantiacum]
MKKAAAKKATVEATSTQEVLFPATTAQLAPQPEPAPAPQAQPEPQPERTPEPTPRTEPAQQDQAEAQPESESRRELEPEPQPEPRAESLVAAAVEVVEADPTDLGTSAEAAGVGRQEGGERAGFNPAYLPEFLALSAVARLGESARERVAWYAVNYPGADGDAVGRAITREFVRRARRLGFVAGAAGSLGLVVEAAGVGWLQAKLVLHLAAAHGHDPLDRRRAAELLVLQRVYAEVATAEAALLAAEQAQRSRRAGPGVGVSRLAGPLGRVVGGGLLQAAGVRIARRAVPGIGPVVGAVAAVRSTEAIAMRATRYYRRRGSRPEPGR